jgi:hypothetical protein
MRLTCKTDGVAAPLLTFDVAPIVARRVVSDTSPPVLPGAKTSVDIELLSAVPLPPHIAARAEGGAEVGVLFETQSSGPSPIRRYRMDVTAKPGAAVAQIAFVRTDVPDVVVAKLWLPVGKPALQKEPPPAPAAPVAPPAQEKWIVIERGATR